MAVNLFYDMKKRIILDTNFLLAIGQFNIDIFSELERICDFPYSIYVLDKTVDELNRIASGKKDKASAKLVLDIIKDRVKILKTKKGYADDLLVDLAGKDTVIATQDKGLKKRIKTKIITMRQKKYLVFRH